MRLGDTPNELQFDPVEHKYTLNGRELESVSNWIKQYVPEFQAGKIAGMIAKRAGLETKDILRKWKQKGYIATSYGTAIHEAIDYYVNYGESQDNKHLKTAVEAFKRLSEGWNIESEVRVHNDTNAGTIDLIQTLNENEVVLHDYKTNADLYKNKAKGKDKYLLAPYDHLENMPINKYRLQLSKYKQLVEGMRNVEVVGLNIWHWDGTDFEVIPVEPLILDKI